MKATLCRLLLSLVIIVGPALVNAAGDNEINPVAGIYSTKDLILYGSLGVRLLSPNSL